MLLVAHHVIVYYVKLSCANLSLKNINCIIDSATFVTMKLLRIFTVAFLLTSAQGVPTDCARNYQKDLTTLKENCHSCLP